MKKVALVKEVMAADGEEDKEEVEVMENNTSMEMKRGLETSQRKNVIIARNLDTSHMNVVRVRKRRKFKSLKSRRSLNPPFSW